MQITASHWQLLSPLLDDALLLAPTERLLWLDQQTQLTTENLAQLRQLIALANAPETDHFFQNLTCVINAPTAALKKAATTRQTGDHVGAYQLLRLLGSGGMAEVWLARRSDGAYERDVALKLPLTHLPHNIAAERLLRERNVLAALEHPAIARLYDAGVAADGQPFLAMEYVEGESIVDHATRLQLDLRARCQLMIQVLDALHYAHQHLVVHRDLKPSNIMVRADGRVTLLDFGIAKVLESETANTEATELTRVMGTALTLAYAAPEQLLAEPVTTATDLFSVGVVMYELLSGTRPFAQAERSATSLLQAMDAAAPPDRIARTSATAAQSHGYDTVAAWQRAFRGDLAAICARALRREPAKRYASALSMQEDLRRYFEHRPVQARAGAWVYYSRKFFTRHRLAIGISAVAGLALVALTAQVWQKTQDSRVNAARATTIESVVKNLFDGMNPNSNNTRTFTAKELLDRSQPLMMQAGATSADARRQTTLMMAKLYLDIGAFDDARRLLDGEIADARAVGDVRRDVWAQCLLADLNMDQSAYPLAYEAMARARNELKAVNGQTDLLHSEVTYRLGTAALFMQKLDEADQHLQEANTALRRAREPATELLANVLVKRGTLARMRGNVLAATEFFSDAQKQLQGTTGMQLTKDALAIEMLPVLVTAGRYDETIKQAEALLAQFSTRSAPDAQFPIVTTIHYATALLRLGRFQEAAAQAAHISAQAPADGGVRYQAKAIEAQIDLFSGHLEKAELALKTLIAEPRDKPSAAFLQRVRRNLAHNYLQQGRDREALALLRDIEKVQSELFTDKQNPDVAVTRILIGVALLRRNDVAAAKPLLTAVRDAMLATRGASHYGSLLAESYLALIAAADGAPAANAATLAARVERELGWQHGAADLAARLKKASPTRLITAPAIL